MPIPASELAVAYSDDYGAPRPPLQMMIGQKGLNMPRAQLLAQLPPLRLPQRTPRSVPDSFSVSLLWIPFLLPLFNYCLLLFCL
ncbi:hypothetical protein LINGRAHAP2_LOCUS14436 [Linum grandiflorum]